MTKNIIILTFFIFGFSSVNAQTFENMNMGGAKQKNYFTVIPYEDVNSLPIIKVEINGVEYRFLLDTGAPLSIRIGLQEKLQSEIISKIPVSDAEGKSDSMSVCLIPDILIGGVVFSNVPALVIKDDVEFVKCMNIDGIIGSNLLRESIVRFSYAEKSITITDELQKLDLHLKEDQSGGLFLEPFQSSPYIKTILVKDSTSAVEVEHLFDTGMADFYNMALDHMNHFKEIDFLSDSDVLMGYGSTSHSIHGKTEDTLQFRLRMPLMVIHDYPFKDLTITSTSNDNSRIGARFLEYGDFTIDYANKHFYFEPYSNEITDLYEKYKSFSINLVDGMFMISIIWDESLKDRVNIGDQILAINDVELESLDVCELFVFDFDEINNKESNIYKLKDKNGNIREVILEE